MQLVWRRIRESLEQHRRAALISVIKVDGSAPREVGARMVVQQDAGFFGTIGGGRLEYEALAVAEAALSAEAPVASVRVWPLGPNLGQCCGGSVTTLIETFEAGDLDSIRELAAAEEAGLFVTISRMTAQGRIAREILDGDVDRAEVGKGAVDQRFVERFGEVQQDDPAVRRRPCRPRGRSGPVAACRFRCAGSTPGRIIFRTTCRPT